MTSIARMAYEDFCPEMAVEVSTSHAAHRGFEEVLAFRWALARFNIMGPKRYAEHIRDIYGSRALAKIHAEYKAVIEET